MAAQEEKRQKYVEHIEEILVLANFSSEEAKAAAEAIMKLELGIAEARYAQHSSSFPCWRSSARHIVVMVNLHVVNEYADFKLQILLCILVFAV